MTQLLRVKRKEIGKDEPIPCILDTRENVTPALIGLAWLFHRSPVIIAIPGTSSLKHLEENAEACRVTLSAQDMAVLDKLSTA